MRNSDQKSIRAVMSGEAVGPKAAMLRAGLRVVEPFYAVVMRARNLLYDTGIFRSHDLGRPVIAFGNITTGGTGKTPLVRWAAEQLRARGIGVGILSRGYGATKDNPLGDELTMLQHQLNHARNTPIAIVANSDRVSGAAKLLSEGSEVSVILLDDAFQHRRANRDLNIVLVNATEPFGFNHVLPRGLLREPLSGLQRAGAIVLTHVNRVGESEISNLKFKIGRYAPAAPIYHTSHKPSGVLTPNSATPLESISAMKFYGFCGIGTPAAFERDIGELGNLVGFHAFDDHQAYTPNDIAMLGIEAIRAGARVLLTTEKDWVKLAPLAIALREIPIWRVDMRIAFEADHEARLRQQMLDAIKRGTK